MEVYREAMLAWQEHEEHLDCDKIQVGRVRSGRSGDRRKLARLDPFLSFLAAYPHHGEPS